MILFDTLEVRWFSSGDIPPFVQNWYSAAAPTSLFEGHRVDYYLDLVNEPALGIKIRGGFLEVKQLQAALGSIRFRDHVLGCLEAWRKWAIPINLAKNGPYRSPEKPWIPVGKQRQMARTMNEGGEWIMRGGKVEPGIDGCEVELTTLQIEGQAWWTMALEASGPKDQLDDILTESGRRFFSFEYPPPLSASNSYGYPSWLSRFDE